MLRNRIVSVLASSALVAGFTVLVVAQAPPAFATSITVNTATDPAPNAQGKFPTDGLCSLRAAIQSAQNNSNANDVDCATGLGNNVLDSIHINATLAGKTLTLTNGPFDIVAGTDNPMEIIGPTTTSSDFVISGGNATRIFLFGYQGFGGPSPSTSAVVKLANLTVTKGNGTGGGAFFPDGDGGAAVLGDGTSLTLDNVVFSNNVVTGSARGGAIFANQATITNNGGAYINNHANGNGGTGAGGGRGGAIAFFNAASVMNGYALLMEGNTATYSGGAMAAMNGNDKTVFHLERGLLKDNNGGAAGGVYWTESTLAGQVLELQDSTVTGNTATAGGVFFAQASTQSFSYLRDTFVNNTGDGGLFYAGKGDIRNSIFNGSSCHNTTATSNFTSGSNLGGGTGCAYISSGGAVTGLDSTLAQNGGPEVQRTYRLMAGSNAIDSGSKTYCGTIDARSLPRGTDGNGIKDNPAVGDCDIGAYEYVKYVVNFVTGTSSVLEGQSSFVQVKLTIPDPADRPLASSVTIPITRDQSSTARSGIDYTVPPGGVTFPAGSGATGTATVNYTVITLQDNIAERFGENVLFHLGVASGAAVAEPKDHTLSIQDDDQAGFTKSDGGNGTTVSEATPGTTDSFSIALRSQPDYSQPDPNDSNSYGPPADVTVSAKPDRDCTIVADGHPGTEASPAQFTILNADWQTAHNVVVTPINDLYDEDLRDESAPHKCTITFTFNSTDPVYNATTDAYDVNVIDNDVAGVTLSKTSLNLVEGGLTDSFTVKLDTPPDPGKPLPGVPRAATTVTVDPDTQCDVGNGPGVPKVLSFTAANYSTAQTVNVTAVDDLTVELAHSCGITSTVGGGDPVYTDLSQLPVFAKTPATVSGAIQDYNPPTITNDPPQVDLSTGTGLSVSEATPGTGKQLTVVLDRQPLNQNVVVHLASSSDPRIPGPQVLVQDNNPATPAAPAGTLDVTFTPANWNTAQIVNVFATNDDYDEADTHAAKLTATMTSTAVGFNDATLRKFKLDGDGGHLETVDVPVTIADNDTSSIVLSGSASSVAVTEGGADDTYTVALGTHPYDDVTVTVDPDPQCAVNGGAAGAPATLSFPHATWNTPQTVTVSAVDDALVEGTHTCAITHTAHSTADALYDGLVGGGVTGVVTDNDLPRVVLHPDAGISLSEGTPATTDSYTVDLAGQPDADVVVTVTDDGQETVDKPTLTFTSANWNVPQTVTVTVVDDAVDETDPHTGTLHHAVTSTATGFSTAAQVYNGANPAANGDLPVTIADNDAASVTVTESGGSTAVTEGGTTDTYTVVLGSKPAKDVVITPTPGSECTVSPASLTFDGTNWSTPQTVTVKAVDDALVEDPTTCTIAQAATSADAPYNGIAVASVTATVTSDDVGGVAVTAAPLNLAEATPGTTDSYAVVLTAQPTSDVTVTSTISDGQTTFDGAATTTSLTFTNANWSLPQTVNLHAVDDAVHEASPHTGTVVLSVSSTALGFTDPVVKVDGVTTKDVVASIADNDSPNLSLAVSGGAASAVPGDSLTYKLDWAGAAGYPGATGAVITTTVPASTTFQPTATTDAWSCGGVVVAGTTCTLSLGTVAPGASGSVTFPVKVNDIVGAGDETTTLTATIGDDGLGGTDSDTTNNTATSTAALDATPDLAVALSDGGVSTSANGVVKYVSTVTNVGNQVAGGVVITQKVPVGTRFSSANSSSGWSCATNSPPGTVCTLTVGDVGAPVAKTFAVVANATFPSGFEQLSDTASVGSSGADASPANNSATDTTPVTAVPELLVQLTDYGISVRRGGVIKYRIHYANTGTQSAARVVVTQTVPANTRFSKLASQPGWSCAQSSPAGTLCKRIFTGVVPGGSGNIIFAVRVNSTAPSSVRSIRDTVTIKDNGVNGAEKTLLNNKASESTPLVR